MKTYSFIDIHELKKQEAEKYDKNLNIVYSRYNAMLEDGYIPVCVLVKDNDKHSFKIFDVRKPSEDLPEEIKEKCKSLYNKI